MNYQKRKRRETDAKAVLFAVSGLRQVMEEDRWREEFRKEFEEEKKKKASKPQQLTLFWGEKKSYEE